MVDPYRLASERPVGSRAVYIVGRAMTERVRGHQHSRGPYPAGVQWRTGTVAGCVTIGTSCLLYL